MASKVSLPTSRYDMFSVNIKHLDLNLYFGRRFETAIRNAGLSWDADKRLHLRSRRFIIDLFSQLHQRLPENIQHQKKCRSFPWRTLGRWFRGPSHNLQHSYFWMKLCLPVIVKPDEETCATRNGVPLSEPTSFGRRLVPTKKRKVKTPSRGCPFLP